MFTWDESDLADEDPLGGEVEVHHDEPAVLPLQVDRHVPRLLPVPAAVQEIHRPVVTELALLVGEVDLDPGEDLDIPGAEVVGVNEYAGEGPQLVEGEIHLERTHTAILPTNPLVTLTNSDLDIKNIFFVWFHLKKKFKQRHIDRDISVLDTVH